MTSTKRKIYIVIIITCFAASGAVLYFGLKSPVAPAPGAVNGHPLDTNNIVNSSNAPASVDFQPSAGDSINFPTPVVFPRDIKFDWSLTESQDFKSLVAVPDLVLDPNQVGRPNPFSK
jgi:hypothetical protein